MNTATLTTTSGHNWQTSVNGTFEEVKAYFINKAFNVGSYPEERVEACVALSLREPNGDLIETYGITKEEFKEGDTVTFLTCNGKDVTAKVTEVYPNGHGFNSENVAYRLEGASEPLLTVASGLSIKESQYFDNFSFKTEMHHDK